MKRKDQFPLIHFLGAHPENGAPLGLLKGRRPESAPRPGRAERGLGLPCAGFTWPGSLDLGERIHTNVTLVENT